MERMARTAQVNRIWALREVLGLRHYRPMPGEPSSDLGDLTGQGFQSCEYAAGLSTHRRMPFSATKKVAPKAPRSAGHGGNRPGKMASTATALGREPPPAPWDGVWVLTGK
jgi:hypothetical protein